jgi:hypothetical protein
MLDGSIVSRAFSLAAISAVVWVASASFIAASASPSLTNATLFNADSTGTNLGTVNSGATVGHGAYTTQPATQNVPGNYGANLFISTIPNPTSADFLSPANPLSIALSPGANTFYFWADGYDAAGGTGGFGLNLWIDGAAASNPGIAAFASTSTIPSSSFVADSTSGCTSDFNFACVPGAGTLSVSAGGDTISLTAFSIEGLGGATANPGCQDKVGTDNNSPAIMNTPNGICDNFGTFTLTDTPAVAAPEPASAALVAFGLIGISCCRVRKPIWLNPPAA